MESNEEAVWENEILKNVKLKIYFLRYKKYTFMRLLRNLVSMWNKTTMMIGMKGYEK